MIGATPGFMRTNTPNFAPGYFQQWNLSIERQIAKGLVAQASYVGSKGTNLNGDITLNDYDPALRAKVVQYIPQSFFLDLRAKGFNSNYNSLQLSLRKDTAHGLSFLGSYTWSHALAEASNDDVAENVVTDYDLNALLRTYRSWSNADFDVRQRFVINGLYALPLGRGKKWGKNWNNIAQSLLGGWQANWILTLSAGYPYTVFDTRNRRADRICDGNLPRGQRSADKWYDYTCFPSHVSTSVKDPVTGNIVEANIQGNTGANIIVGPGISNLDFGIQKNFSTMADTRLQLRVEAFNAFNHVNPNVTGFASGNVIFFNNASGAQIRRARDMRQIQVALKFIF
jgi:hypothetical protein